VLLRKQDCERLFSQVAGVYKELWPYQYIEKAPEGIRGFGTPVKDKGIPILYKIQDEHIPKIEEMLDYWKIGFGKHKGKTLKEVLLDDPQYVQWAAGNVSIGPVWLLL